MYYTYQFIEIVYFDMSSCKPHWSPDYMSYSTFIAEWLPPFKLRKVQSDINIEDLTVKGLIYKADLWVNSIFNSTVCLHVTNGTSPGNSFLATKARSPVSSLSVNLNQSAPWGLYKGRRRCSSNLFSQSAPSAPAPVPPQPLLHSDWQ